MCDMVSCQYFLPVSIFRNAKMKYIMELHKLDFQRLLQELLSFGGYLCQCISDKYIKPILQKKCEVSVLFAR